MLWAEYPESEVAFRLESHELQQMNRYTESDRLAEERLQRIPDDIQALRTQFEVAMGRGDYATADEWNTKTMNHEMAVAQDFNSAAWKALFTGKVTQADMDYALRAMQLAEDETSIMHTLACLYIEQDNGPKATVILCDQWTLCDFRNPTGTIGMHSADLRNFTASA